jgi:hypothetical protein
MNERSAARTPSASVCTPARVRAPLSASTVAWFSGRTMVSSMHADASTSAEDSVNVYFFMYEVTGI